MSNPCGGGFAVLEPNEAAVALIMQQLGTGMQQFQGRLKVQKCLYLLEQMGVDLGFRFNWYIRGPYCPALADIGFHIEQDAGQGSGAEALNEWTLQGTVQEKLDALKLVVDAAPQPLTTERWAELLASLHFLAQLPTLQGRGRDDVEADLLRRKPYLASSQAAFPNAWERLACLALKVPES